jgi:hypothetical protein
MSSADGASSSPFPRHGGCVEEDTVMASGDVAAASALRAGRGVRHGPRLPPDRGALRTDDGQPLDKHRRLGPVHTRAQLLRGLADSAAPPRHGAGDTVSSGFLPLGGEVSASASGFSSRADQTGPAVPSCGTVSLGFTNRQQLLAHLRAVDGGGAAATAALRSGGSRHQAGDACSADTSALGDRVGPGNSFTARGSRACTSTNSSSASAYLGVRPLAAARLVPRQRIPSSDPRATRPG